MAAAAATLQLLVVDDREDNREVETRLFELYGVAADAVATAEEAIEALEGQAYSAVVTDINLLDEPGDKSGVALARSIHKRWAVPIVGYSGVAGELPARDRRVFQSYVARGDDPPDKLIATAILAASPGSIPHAKYPVVSLGMEATPADGSAQDVGGEVDMTEGARRIVLSPVSTSPITAPVEITATEEDGEVTISVDNHPSLHGSGPDFDAAVRDVLDVMRYYAELLGSRDDSALGRGPLATKRFIESVIGTSS